MSIQEQIEAHIGSLSEPKRSEIKELHERILPIFPGCKIWFTDGKNDDGKQVTNPDIGYGAYTINYANGTSREFYRVGLSATATGISVYILGLEDKTYLAKTYGEKLGKATVTGYCIKFKTVKNIDVNVLLEAIRFGFEYQS